MLFIREDVSDPVSGEASALGVGGKLDIGFDLLELDGPVSVV